MGEINEKNKQWVGTFALLLSYRSK